MGHNPHKKFYKLKHKQHILKTHQTKTGLLASKKGKKVENIHV